MEARMSGVTHGDQGFDNTLGYLGTDADNSRSHSNPKRDEYYRAKARGDKLTMSRDAIYLKRDISTFSNMKGRKMSDFRRDERNFMKNSRHNVKSIEFVISPDPKKDHIDPNNPEDVDRFKKYVQLWLNNCFNGSFEKSKLKSKSGYHLYSFKRDKYDHFCYIADVQCDSHDSSNTHCHVIILNKSLSTGNSINHLFYGKNHLRHATKRATLQFNKLYPSHEMTSVNPKRIDKKYKLRKPTRLIAPIIQAVNTTLDDDSITSRKKFINALEDKNIAVHHLHKTKKRKHDVWRFRYTGDHKTHSWVNLGRLRRYIGGSNISPSEISKRLHQNLITTMNARRESREHARASEYPTNFTDFLESQINSDASEAQSFEASSVATSPETSTSIRANRATKPDLDNTMQRLQPNGQEDLGTQLTIQPNTKNEDDEREAVHDYYDTSHDDRSTIDNFVGNAKDYAVSVKNGLQAIFRRYQKEASEWLKHKHLRFMSYLEIKLGDPMKKMRKTWKRWHEKPTSSANVSSSSSLNDEATMKSLRQHITNDERKRNEKNAEYAHHHDHGPSLN